MAKRRAGQDRERLARRAAGGDLEAARRLVRLLEGRDEPEDRDDSGFDEGLVERAGRSLLSWSGIPARNAAALRRFLDAIGHSTIPEAAGDVGFSVLGDDRAIEEGPDEDDPDAKTETWNCWCPEVGFIENEATERCAGCGATQEEAVDPPEDDRGRWWHP